MFSLQIIDVWRQNKIGLIILHNKFRIHCCPNCVRTKEREEEMVAEAQMVSGTAIGSGNEAAEGKPWAVSLRRQVTEGLTE